MQTQQVPTGILSPAGIDMAFDLDRFAPSEDLQGFVLRYWMVTWDVPEETPYTQETLPYPCVNLAVERGRSGIFGVNTRRFQAELAGAGRVFGIKFHPGGFYPFYRRPVAALTDRVIGLESCFGAAGLEYEHAMLGCTTPEAMIECAEEFLRIRLPPPDDTVTMIHRVVELIASDRTITRADQAADYAGVSQRTLQRIFAQYVGVSPKWVIRRYRLLEAAHQLANTASIDLPDLAQELGYFDQAHFSNDFRATVGSTPAEYARNLERSKF
jgi:AraC-like DNA-binding protein